VYNRAVTKLRGFLAAVILVLSLAMLVWSYWPAARETRVVELPAAELSLPTP
jgi:hypothetical protein